MTGSIVAKGGQRDARQVLANGGVFGVAVLGMLIQPGLWWTALGAGALAASAADTWATEIGTRFGGEPRSILSRRPVPAGTSGGVTVIGSLGALAGALFVAAVSIAIGWTRLAALSAVAGGVVGALADSLLGATVQARRWCDACGVATERVRHDCGSSTRAAGGVSGLDNDMVNLFSGILGGAAATAIFMAVFARSAMNADVLVVGGGPAGSSLAVALARRGVDVLLVDRARFPRPKPCAEYLSPEASRVLDAMGALERVKCSGAAALSGVRVRAPNGLVIAGDFVAQHGFRAYADRGLSVRREVLDEILFDCARSAGARVAEGVRITDLVRDSSGRVTGAKQADGEPIRARFTIGADGLRSVVARRLGLARTTRWPRRLALVTHYVGVRDVGEQGEMHVERDGYVGIADVGHGATTVALVVPASRAREHLARIAPRSSRRGSGRILISRRDSRAPSACRPSSSRGRSARIAAVPGRRVPRWSATRPISSIRSPAKAFTRRCAAASCCPTLSSKALGARDGGEEALRAYDRARRKEFGGKWIVERVIGAVVGWPPLINRAAKRLSARKDLADLLIGVTGNFVPASEVVRWSYVWKVFVG